MPNCRGVKKNCSAVGHARVVKTIIGNTFGGLSIARTSSFPMIRSGGSCLSSTDNSSRAVNSTVTDVREQSAAPVGSGKESSAPLD
jgi:hypothetical protein